MQPRGATGPGIGKSCPAHTRLMLIRIAIADAHPVVREGLRTLLQAEGFQVIGNAGDGAEALRLVQAKRPDVLMLDAGLPGMPSIDVLRELAKAGSPCRVILLNAPYDRPQILDWLRVGARGFISKHTSIEMMIKSIRTVMAGQYWIGRESVSDLIGSLVPAGGAGQTGSSGARPDLSKRERQIVSAVAAGYGNKDIATRLRLSEHTVKHHLSNIFDKLGVTNRLEVALFAIKHHLVDDRDTSN
jgi:two-component system, NarL family, nitrate/nitrite response regulator NarL